MAIEIEKKYRLTQEQYRAMASALYELGAVFEGEDLEENVIYGGGVLDEAGAIVRLRKTQKAGILTYKKRIAGTTPVKQQIEYESEVSDPAEIAAILGCLGLEPRLVYEKRRKTWKFRSVEVVLDELPFGLYMEIEGTIMNIAEAEMFLEIDELTPEDATYPQLTVRYGRPNGNLIEARFDK